MGAPSGPTTSSADAGAAASSRRGSWKSRLMGSSTNNQSNNNNSNTNNAAPSPASANRRRSASPSMRRFSHRSSAGDEKKEDADVLSPLAAGAPAGSNNHVGTAAKKPEMTRSLSGSRAERSQKKGMRGRLRQFLPKSHNNTSNSSRNNNSSNNNNDSKDRSKSQTDQSEEDGKKKESGKRRYSKQQQSPASKLSPQGKPLSPDKDSLFQWQDAMEEKEQRDIVTQKQLFKERDGFCRRVDTYDGQVIGVDGAPTYELGNYLGGGVAGVVYEGHRLRSIDEYPVRSGLYDGAFGSSQMQSLVAGDDNTVAIVQDERDQEAADADVTPGGPFSYLCAPAAIDILDQPERSMSSKARSTKSDRTELTGPSTTGSTSVMRNEDEIAIEATSPNDKEVIIMDTVDAPSRSKHYAKAVAFNAEQQSSSSSNHPVNHLLMEETVAIKILNPVGFRIMSPELSKAAVVVRRGEEMEKEVKKGLRPMEERHVWWLVNPNSRNLRTLQRYKGDRNSEVRGPRVDRGSPEKGLRISLVAALMDPTSNELRELPLTRCIEIWGHIQFSASDNEFREMMEAIDRVNAGLPAPHPDFFANMQRSFQRSGTGGSSDTASLSMESKQAAAILNPLAMTTARTGLYRAVATNRRTVYCESLNAYIALPAVPSKYIRWLRQRRAATKEIRNMMLIGRHRNVVHLFEVLEHIHETKSTMFLILELVKGGELFDLISSNAARVVHSERIPEGFDENETIMRKFFRELASGVAYCHSNGIAHRDLKPENLLVHNGVKGGCTLKIADFGLSAAFGPQLQHQNDQETVADSLPPPGMSMNGPGMAGLSLYNSDTDQQTRRGDSVGFGEASVDGDNLAAAGSMERLLSQGAGALSFFTCGAVDDVVCGGNGITPYEDQPAAPLKRMTSVVGSPHYVAPEIISQTDSSSKRQQPGVVSPLPGYDGTKADVWSAGVILYAMLFRSLPFGEDLLRCPRYQSYRKWYIEARRKGGRRSSAAAALHPNITESDEKQFLGPHWFFPSNSSIESRDLIVAMLNPDPEDRPNIQLVLRHPWLSL